MFQCFLRCGFVGLPGILGKTGNLRLPEAEVMLSQRPEKWNMHLHGVLRRRSGWAHGNHTPPRLQPTARHMVAKNGGHVITIRL